MFGRSSRELFTPPAIDIPGDGELRVRFNTNQGVITAKLFEEDSPLTVANFVYLATGGHTEGRPYYDGIVFHRVIPNFMIQGGCPDGIGTGGPGYVIKDEFAPGFTHDRPGLLSMANKGPNTGGSQFFVTEVPTQYLDNKHAIFGEVIEGLEIVTKITRLPRDRGDRPNEEVVMERVEIFRA